MAYNVIYSGLSKLKTAVVHLIFSYYVIGYHKISDNKGKKKN